MIASYVFLLKSLYLSLSVLSVGHQLLLPPFLNEPRAGPGQFLGHKLLYDQFSALCCVLRGQLSPAVLLMGPRGESCWVPWTLMPPWCVGCLIFFAKAVACFPLLLSHLLFIAPVSRSPRNACFPQKCLSLLMPIFSKRAVPQQSCWK